MRFLALSIGVLRASPRAWLSRNENLQGYGVRTHFYLRLLRISGIYDSDRDVQLLYFASRTTSGVLVAIDHHNTSTMKKSL